TELDENLKRQRIEPEQIQYLAALLVEGSKVPGSPPANLVTLLKTNAADPESIPLEVCEGFSEAMVCLGGSEVIRLLEKSILKLAGPEMPGKSRRRAMALLGGMFRSEARERTPRHPLPFSKEFIVAMQGVFSKASAQEI